MPGHGLSSQHARKRRLPFWVSPTQGQRSILTNSYSYRARSKANKGNCVQPKSIPGPRTDPWGPPFQYGTQKKKKRERAETCRGAARESLDAAGMSQAEICWGAPSTASPPTHVRMSWGFSYRCPPSLTATSLVN